MSINKSREKPVVAKTALIALCAFLLFIGRQIAPGCLMAYWRVHGLVSNGFRLGLSFSTCVNVP